MPKTQTVHIPVGYALTITPDAFSSGSYVRRDVPGGSEQYTPVPLSASTAVTIGPFNEGRDYALYSTHNDYELESVFSGVYTGVDDADTIKTTNNVADLTALGETNVPEITDAGELLAAPITTATVNSILEVLIAAGLMDAPEA